MGMVESGGPSLSVVEAIDVVLADDGLKSAAMYEREKAMAMVTLHEFRAQVEREAAFVRAAKAAFAARAALDPHSSEYPAQVDHLTALTDEAALAYRALALEREA